MTDFFRKQYRFKIQSLSAREPCQTTLQRRVLPQSPSPAIGVPIASRPAPGSVWSVNLRAVRLALVLEAPPGLGEQVR